MKPRLIVLLVATFTACASVTAWAQITPLPEDMVADFAPPGAPQAIWAEELRLPTSPDGSWVRGRLTFDNAAADTVSVRWIFSAPGAAQRSSSQTIELSMRPTAIARRAGTTDTFYVVGWSERTSRVIVERCTFGPFTLATASTRDGGSAVSTFSPPSLTRVVEWMSEPDSVPPIWDAACQFAGDELLLLASGTPTRLYTLDLVTHSIVETWSGVTEPALAGHRMISIALHPDGGLIALTERRRTWDHAMTASTPDDYFVLRDTDLDGTFDVVGPEPTETFYFQYPPPWDNAYGK